MNPERCTTGTGHLGVEMVADQSAVTSVWAVNPLKILVPRPRGPSVWACLSSLGGGLLAGDELDLTIKLGERGRCFLTTQASTKVYRSPTGRPCRHQLRAQLGRGAVLALVPDPVQAFMGSHYRQLQAFSLAPQSGLVLVDWVCSGRAARGERWAFSRFQSRNEIFLGEKRVLIDSLLLDAVDGPLDDLYRMGRFNCLALVVVIGEPLGDVAKALLQEVANSPAPQQAQLVVSVSPIAEGALLRLAGESVEEIASQIRRRLSFLSERLQDDPWSRKL